MTIVDIPDNVIQPFQLETSGFRGRLVKLGGVLDDILEPHGYPDLANQVLGETITLCALLSSMLKYEGVFTLQTKGDGPIPMLVSDMTSSGLIRGCATISQERLESLRKQLSAFSKDLDEGSNNQLAQLLGKGYIAFTVDQGEHTDRYQGIVELKGASLVDCVQHYFAQSEQIHTGIKMAVGQRDGRWRAAGIMIQHMPEEGGHENVTSNIDEDDWRRSMIFLDSCTEDEFLDPDITPNMLLTRLFHEEGVRVFEPVELEKGCRCNKDRVKTVIQSLSDEEREGIIVDGAITLTCEFCSTDFTFNPKDFKKTTTGHAQETQHI